MRDGDTRAAAALRRAHDLLKQIVLCPYIWTMRVFAQRGANQDRWSAQEKKGMPGGGIAVYDPRKSV